MKVPARIVVVALFILSFNSCKSKSGELLLSGVLETYDYDLMAPYAAKLGEVRVKEGDLVNEGDTVAILDTVTVGANLRSAQSAVNIARANLDDLLAGSDMELIAAAEASLQSANDNVEQSERDFKRAQDLHNSKLIDDSRFEDIRLQLQTAKNNKQIASENLAKLKRGARAHVVDAAEAALEQAKAQMSGAQKQYDDAFLTASIKGVVDLIPYQIDELVPAGRSAATLHSLQELWVKIFVPENNLDRIKTGDTLSFKVDAYPDESFKAVVTYISTSAEFTPRNVQTQDERLNLVFAVKLVVVGGFEKLRAGMPADFIL